jgi:hypothetical protein
MQGLVSWAEGVAQDVETQVKEFFGGVQGGVSFDTEQGFSGGVAFGERRVMSWSALAVAVLAGALVAAFIFKG